MAQMLRFLILIVTAGFLSGCILQSKTPLFSDKDGVLMLGKKTQRFANYELSGLVWKKGGDTATFEPVAKHYKVSNGKNSATAEFIALSGGNYVMQFDEGKGSFVYTLASPHGKEIFLYILLCDHLKKQKIAGVRFEKDNCFIEPSFGRAGFEVILKHLPIANVKLQAE
jgi:hypothetical protein